MRRKSYVILVVVSISLILIIWNLSNKKETKFTKEYIVNEFEENKHYFELVQEYIYTQPLGYYVSKKNYKETIKDEEVINAITYIFDELEYDDIFTLKEINYKQSFIIFLKYTPGPPEVGIVYTENKMKYGLIMDKIIGNWHFHWLVRP